MKYYRVRHEMHDWFTGYTAVPGELVTQRERDTMLRYIPDSNFEEVNISCRKTVFIFGCRYEMKGE